jgi:ring-1,2-phenylacetyl-CoA epoxidase subunit PaaC
MNQDLLIQHVTALADDAMVLGQRLSELCSRGPYMEEDLAMTNVALDYIGRASMLYQYAAELTGGDCTEDSLAFRRNERQFTNLLIHEIPNGDFAFTMVRQYFLDVFYSLYLAEMVNSTDETLAAIASKAIKETNYHLKRSRQWIKQLALGTDESRERTVNAVVEIEDYVSELFMHSDAEQALLDTGLVVDRASLKDGWLRTVNDLFAEVQLDTLKLERAIKGGRKGIHTEHLGHLLSEMQFLQRAYPNLDW